MSENIEQPQMFAPDSQKSEGKKCKSENPDKMIKDLVGVFTDPLIVFPGGWEDTLPDWIKTEIIKRDERQPLLSFKN